jgi:hypothetical protein
MGRQPNYEPFIVPVAAIPDRIQEIYLNKQFAFMGKLLIFSDLGYSHTFFIS